MTVRTYLDHAATTPMRPEAIVAVAEGMARWANPSSPHGEGRAARRALEEARARIAAALDWDGEVILTSGASEAIGMAMRGAAAGDRLVAATEHDAVLRFAGKAARLPVFGNGHVDLRAIQGDRPLVAIQTANSETGVIQPAQAIAPAVHGSGGLWLADASQTAGRMPLPAADFIVVSAHKLGGPIGIGALLVRDLAHLSPTGGQERGYRGGTENLPGALGFEAALDAPRQWLDALPALRDGLDAAIVAAGGAVVAGDTPRIPTIASYQMPGVSAGAQLIRFDMAGFAVSAGSACSSGSMRPSHVLAAMGIAPDDAADVIRVSFGWSTTAAEVDAFADLWRRTAAGARAAS